jgi:hypothetical protein
VILTRSRLCPGPKPGSSLHLHVLSTPPAFVLSQDQTLRKKCDVTDRQSQESCHVADFCHRVHRAVTDMTELFNPRPVHDGRESGSSNEGRVSLITRCSVFKDHPAGATGLVASTLCSSHKKGPSFEGPETKRPRRGRSGLLLRGGSLRDPKQERPRSIAPDRPPVQEPTLPVRRRKRRLPTCRTFPLSSAAGRSRRSPSSASPSSFTAP